MGFYAPAQLVQDARRHGVEVRSADVCLSDWDCTLEGRAVRLGLRMVGGLSQAGAERIVAARPVASVAELAQRARLDRKDLRALAGAGALRSLAGHRRLAHWHASGAESRPALEVPLEGAVPRLAAPSEGEEIVADYASLGLTLGRHPLALLRAHLERLGLARACDLAQRSHGSSARAAGLVTCRQRPDTASGVIFVTLEDETGTVNVVVWTGVAERQRKELLSAQLLGVEGRIERDGDVVHLVANRLADHSPLLAHLSGPLAARSRDFR